MKISQKILFVLLLFIINVSGQSKAKLSISDAIEDVDFMVKTIEDVHYNAYFKTSKAAFSKIKDSLLKQWPKDSVNLKNFTITNLKLTALLSNGHTGFDWQNQQILPELLSYSFFPFQVEKRNEKFFMTDSSRSGVWAAYPIQYINDVPVAHIFSEIEQYVGGLDDFKNSYLKQIFPIFLFLNQKVKAPYNVDGKTIQAISIEKFQENISSSLPLEDYSYKEVSNKTGILSYNSCNNQEAFDTFLKKTFLTIANENVTKLIVDIRENTGGDSSLNDRLLSYITTKAYRQSSGRFWKVSPQVKEYIKKDKDSLWYGYFGRDFVSNYLKTPDFEIIKEMDFELKRPVLRENFFKGEVCLLTGPQTFSSANFLADAIKTYDICPIIGLPTGEYTNDFGEQLTFKMPNSGSYFFVSSTFDIGADADLNKMKPVIPDYIGNENEDALQLAIDWFSKKGKAKD